MPSRAKAKEVIEAGAVLADGMAVQKVSQLIAPDAKITIQTDLLRWVSRGALKLLGALQETEAVCVEGAVCADIGASTGGFTQVLIEHGAKRVYAVDVGQGQLAARLRTHPHIINLEQVNARSLSAEAIPEPLDIVVCDVSFISITKALPAALSLLATGGWLITLIKPQFEAGRAAIGKGGVVRDPSIHESVCAEISQWASGEMGFTIAHLLPSPITGPDGNREFLLIARKM